MCIMNQMNQPHLKHVLFFEDPLYYTAQTCYVLKNGNFTLHSFIHTAVCLTTGP
jgi:hypothetical protein